MRLLWEYCKNLWEKKQVGLGRGNEALTEQELLEPVMTQLGYSYLPKKTIPGDRKEPDYLLFVDETAKDSVFEQSTQEQYMVALTVLEAKKVNHPLGAPSKQETPGRFPHQQIRQYLEDSIDDRGNSYFDWAILTNGNLWRLYCRHVQSSTYFEFNFANAVEHLEDFCFFVALFSPKAFLRDEYGKCSLDYLREEALQVQTELEDDLRKRVYTLLEVLVNGFYAWEENNITENDLPQLYENSLIYLYRLLFVLYCEGRGLLPVKPSGPGANKNYRERYSLVRLQSRVRNTVVNFEKNLSDLYEQLLGLFSLINGDKPSRNKACDVPRYNGGLFSHREFPKIDEWRMDEVTLARVLRGLMYSEMPASVGGQSSIDFGETIDYADLEVRQLGSIYEGLLEQHLELENGRVVLKGDKAERKATGTYYTPDYIVQYIVEKTLQPLCDRIEDLYHVSVAKHEGKQNNSFAEEILKLNILDPAMGSGHFLVRATEFLADEIVYHPTTVLQIEEVKRGFSHEAAEFAYWRRRVVESCIYGVDLNPLAVELSKLSLWLTCIAVDQPLSFLDHHFRTGNSLIGAKLSELGHLPEKKKTKQIPFNFGPDLPKAVSEAIAALEEIEATESTEVEVIKEKEKRWKEEVHGRLLPYRHVGDLWLSTFFGLKIKEPEYNHFAKLLVINPKPRTKEARRIRKELRPIVPVLLEARKNRFFHWELEFPEVFFSADGIQKESGGFDAVIGNPPYLNIDDTWGKNNSRLMALQRQYPSIYTDKTDILYYFVGKGISIAKGSVSFIVSRAFLEAYKAKKLRGFILDNSNIDSVIDFQNFYVFKGVGITTCIIVLNNSGKQKSFKSFKLIDESYFNDSVSLVESLYNSNLFSCQEINQSDLSTNSWVFVSKELKKINDKIDACGKPLGSILLIGQGMQTGRNNVFGKLTYETVDSWGLKENQYYKRATNSDIQRYRIRDRGEYLLYPENEKLLDDLPIKAVEYLKTKRESLVQRAAYKRGDCEWWRFTWPLHKEHYNRKRILCPYLSTINRFALDANSEFLSLTDTTVLFENRQNENLKYFLGVLNSTLLFFRFKSIGKLKSGGVLEYFWNSISKLPIRQIDFQNKKEKSRHDRMVELVDSMLELHQQLSEAQMESERRPIEDEIEITEREIDELVYDLYELTEDEVGIVEEEVTH